MPQKVRFCVDCLSDVGVNAVIGALGEMSGDKYCPGLMKRDVKRRSDRKLEYRVKSQQGMVDSVELEEANPWRVTVEGDVQAVRRFAGLVCFVCGPEYVVQYDGTETTALQASLPAATS